VFWPAHVRFGPFHETRPAWSTTVIMAASYLVGIAGAVVALTAPGRCTWRTIGEIPGTIWPYLTASGCLIGILATCLARTRTPWPVLELVGILAAIAGQAVYGVALWFAPPSSYGVPALTRIIFSEGGPVTILALFLVRQKGPGKGTSHVTLHGHVGRPAG
jgi:hypothetical protein